MIVSEEEIRGTKLATHINQSFLSITNSMPPLSELENNESNFADYNPTKYHILCSRRSQGTFKSKKRESIRPWQYTKLDPKGLCSWTLLASGCDL